MELSSDKISAELKVDAASAQQLSTSVSNEKAARPETWLFTRYEFGPDPDRGGFLLLEHRQVFDRQQDAYKPIKPQPTAVNLPTDLGEAMSRDAALREAVLEYCAGLRRALGRRGNAGGLSLLFDAIRDEAGRVTTLKPKWKYQDPTPEAPINKVCVEPVRLTAKRWETDGQVPPDPDEVPADVAQLVLDVKWAHGDLPAREAPAAAQYWNQPLYREWYVRILQRKREVIISRELDRSDFNSSKRPVPAEPSANLMPKARAAIQLMTAAYRELRPEADAAELAEAVAATITPKLLERQRRHGDLVESGDISETELANLVRNEAGKLRG